MTTDSTRRAFTALTAPRVAAELGERSVLCLPLGSVEQHGPHLPLDTDTVIAERFAHRLAAHVTGRYDLWVGPAVPYGLSPEHARTPGTITLAVHLYATLITTLVTKHTRSMRVGSVLLIKGHGGSRGVLEAVVHQLRHSHGVTTCVLHPTALAVGRIPLDSELPEVHAGTLETALMLALDPDRVRLDLLPSEAFPDPGQRRAIGQLVLDRGVTWPWTSDDPALATDGVIGGDPRKATLEVGQKLLTAALDASTHVLDRIDTATSHGPSQTLRRHCAPHT
ncbi:creatininase family protein [Streptomyces chiangmaiensis]|uniref:Creatininase family protein n=1 Tax=Streptomyces chiangmaiensis TaxID=766497 RepID=A0ABU7FKQ5_9ACTN|nr:creatininase family protein [Streptomyces chiangmaiensis]MED7824696.1 creatininase family protein [Streptomyces chiangmaiensis]